MSLSRRGSARESSPGRGSRYGEERRVSQVSSGVPPSASSSSQLPGGGLAHGILEASDVSRAGGDVETPWRPAPHNITVVPAGSRGDLGAAGVVGDLARGRDPSPVRVVGSPRMSVSDAPADRLASPRGSRMIQPRAGSPRRPSVAVEVDGGGGSRRPSASPAHVSFLTSDPVPVVGEGSTRVDEELPSPPTMPSPAATTPTPLLAQVLEGLPDHYKEQVQEVERIGWDAMDWSESEECAGVTLLHWAAKKDLVLLFQYLVSKRADPQQCDGNGRDARKFAEEYDSREVLALLKSTKFD